MKGNELASKKRVLVVCQHYWPENFRINDICDFLVEEGCEVDVLCGIPNYPKGAFFEGYSWFKNRKQEHNGVHVRRVFEIPRGKNITNVGIFFNYISYPIASIFHIPRLLLAKKYDKIFIYQLSPVLMALPGIVLGKLKHIETTVYVLDLWPENFFSVKNLKNPIMRKITQSVSHWHYRQVDKIAAMSEKMKERLLEATQISKDKIIVLPQTCEKLYEKNVHDKTLEKRFKDTFNIMFAGNISPAQSFETIITAARNLRQEGLDDIRWIIVGDGMSRKWVEEEVQKTGVSDAFVFEGMKPMEDIPKYSSTADLLVGCLVKSDLLEATIPAKVMSYIASGKPIVLAMDGEVQDLINKTIGCGYAGPAGDANAFTDNIRKIYKLSAKERQKMGERGRAFHFKHFERNIVLTKLYNFIFS